MGFFIALQFLTAIPPVIRRTFGTTELGRSQAYFPLVGLFLGFILVGLDWLWGPVSPPLVVNALLVLSLVLLTGALHLDGLMDTCDGLFSYADPQQRLDIMRDSRVGSFGVVGGITILLVKFAALSSLPAPFRFATLLVMPTLGRWAMVGALSAFPYARPEGKGTAFRGNTNVWSTLMATMVALVVAVLSLRLLGAVILVMVAVFTWLSGQYVLRKIPGLTGDTYGAICETVEALVLLAVVASAAF